MCIVKQKVNISMNFLELTNYLLQEANPDKRKNYVLKIYKDKLQKLIDDYDIEKRYNKFDYDNINEFSTPEKIVSFFNDKIDPTNGEYLQWIVKYFLKEFDYKSKIKKQAQRGNLSTSLSSQMSLDDNLKSIVQFDYVVFISEDCYKIRSDLREFHKYKRFFNKLEGEDQKYSDINKIKGFVELYKTLDLIKEFIKQEKLEKVGSDEFKELYRSKDYLVIIPLTKKASCVYGAGTRWCTAAKEHNMFDNYDELIIVIDRKNNRKYQLAFEEKMYMDEEDSRISVVNLLENIKEIRNPIFNHLKKKDDSEYFWELVYAVENEKGLWERLEEDEPDFDSLYMNLMYYRKFGKFNTKGFGRVLFKPNGKLAVDIDFLETSFSYKNLFVLKYFIKQKIHYFFENFVYNLVNSNPQKNIKQEYLDDDIKEYWINFSSDNRSNHLFRAGYVKGMTKALTEKAYKETQAVYAKFFKKAFGEGINVFEKYWRGRWRIFVDEIDVDSFFEKYKRLYPAYKISNFNKYKVIEDYIHDIINETEEEGEEFNLVIDEELNDEPEYRKILNDSIREMINRTMTESFDKYILENLAARGPAVNGGGFGGTKPSSVSSTGGSSMSQGSGSLNVNGADEPDYATIFSNPEALEQFKMNPDSVAGFKSFASDPNKLRGLTSNIKDPNVLNSMLDILATQQQ